MHCPTAGIRSLAGQVALAWFALALTLATVPVAHAAPSLPRRFASPDVTRPARAQSASPYDALWIGYPLPSVQATVTAMTPFGGGVAMAGSSFYYGTTIAPRVALWDGVNWHALGDGPPSTINSIVTLGGLLIAGGVGGNTFTGDQPAVFAWNGATWTTIGSSNGGSANGTVNTMAVIGGDLYVGGAFLSINGVAASKIARWDGANWFAVGAGFSSTSTVKALAAHGLTLVAGGTLADYQGIAQWDGASWTQVGAGFQNSIPAPAAGTVNSLVSDGSTLYASGEFNSSGGSSITKVAAWNGATWSGFAGATQSSSALALYGGFPMATVLDGLLRRPQLWNGSIWQPFNQANVVPLSYALDGSTLYAAGSLSQGIGPTPATINAIQSFNGSAWTPVQQAWTPDMRGISNLALCAQEWHGTLYVGGTFGHVGAGSQYLSSPGVAQWNGTEWLSIGAGNQHFDLDVWNDSLVAAADQFVKIWNGTSWRRLGSSPTSSGFFTGFVDGLVVYQGDLYALGPYSANSGATIINGIGRWTGGTWAPVGAGFDGISGGEPVAGTPWGSNLAIGGYFDLAGGAPARNVAYWDGSAYHELGGGANNGVVALVSDGSDLIVGGGFTEVGGASIQGVARWNGGQWHAMGSRARVVYSLRSHDGRIYASGTFLDDSSNPVDGAAVWTGVDWQLLGSGLDSFGSAYGVEFLGDDLYLLGSFNTANGHLARNFAKLPNASTLAVTPPPTHGTRLALAPSSNPSRGSVRLSVTLPASGFVRLAIHDVSGREVARLLDGSHDAGTFSLTWDAHLAPGLYFATLESAGERRNTRVVRLK